MKHIIAIIQPAKLQTVNGKPSRGERSCVPRLQPPDVEHCFGNSKHGISLHFGIEAGDWYYNLRQEMRRLFRTLKIAA